MRSLRLHEWVGPSVLGLALALAACGGRVVYDDSNPTLQADAGNGSLGGESARQDGGGGGGAWQGGSGGPGAWHGGGGGHNAASGGAGSRGKGAGGDSLGGRGTYPNAAGAGGECAGSATPCGGVCVDLQTDPERCGSCNHRCASTEECSDGQCVSSDCPCAGCAMCHGQCVQLQTAPANCGACGIACEQGEVCVSGKCMFVCASRLTVCRRRVVEDAGSCIPRTCVLPEGRSCGFLGNGCGAALDCGSCPSGQICGGGGLPSICGYPPDAGCVPRTCRQSGVVLCDHNGNGCGGPLECGACPQGETCRFSSALEAYACQSDPIGTLPDADADADASANEASAGDAAGRRDGGGAYCADLSDDLQNCGACGHACGSGMVCVGGVCALP